MLLLALVLLVVEVAVAVEAVAVVVDAWAVEDEDKEWVPVTKLGRLVKDGKIKSVDEIYRFSMPVKEYQIIDYFFPTLSDEVVKVMPVQKQTQAGQRTRFKAFVILGDNNGHVGLGVKCSKEVSLAIKGAMALA